MRQIIPFKKELPFKTKVCDITSISLEREINVQDDGVVSGVFHITGDYKMNEGSINREDFSFDLPFDITLDPRYDVKTVTADIDDFYYDVINEDTLKVNIDLFVEAEYLPESETKLPNEILDIEVDEKEKLSEESREGENDVIEDEMINEEEIINKIEEEKCEECIRKDREESQNTDVTLEDTKVIEEDTLDIMKETNIESNSVKEIEKDKKEDDRIISPSIKFEEKKTEELPQNKENVISTYDLFSNLDDTETYTTYYVYIVKEEDTIDKILVKYGITKEDLEDYNDITEIKAGDKVIIPKKSE